MKQMQIFATFQDALALILELIALIDAVLTVFKLHVIRKLVSVRMDALRGSMETFVISNVVPVQQDVTESAVYVVKSVQQADTGNIVTKCAMCHVTMDAKKTQESAITALLDYLEMYAAKNVARVRQSVIESQESVLVNVRLASLASSVI